MTSFNSTLDSTQPPHLPVHTGLLLSPPYPSAHMASPTNPGPRPSPPLPNHRRKRPKNSHLPTSTSIMLRGPSTVTHLPFAYASLHDRRCTWLDKKPHHSDPLASSPLGSRPLHFLFVATTLDACPSPVGSCRSVCVYIRDAQGQGGCLSSLVYRTIHLHIRSSTTCR